tara:strand:- start:854 stop:1333 length:480 start_codon:yes stop_codon:yes gene_type:complete
MRSKIDIKENTSYIDLSSQLSLLGADMILKSLSLLEKNEETFIPQIENEATYAKKISKKETKIYWNQKAKHIIAKINALNINPGSWFELKGFRIKPISVKEIEASGEPGEIIDDNLTVACLENAVRILELQREGKQKMKAEEFLRGSRIKVGTNISSDV